MDSTRTTLTGTGGTVRLGKITGNLVGQTGITFRTPELELNDIGFLINTDAVNQWISVEYRFLEPFSIWRELRFTVEQRGSWDFGKVNTNQGLEGKATMQFKNYYGCGVGVFSDLTVISNADLRGGPSITYPHSNGFWLWAGSDNRKKLRVEVNPFFVVGGEDYVNEFGADMEISYRPFSALQLILAPSYNSREFDLQYTVIWLFRHIKSLANIN